jgi:RiboL-PSP-HEPN
MSKSADAFKDSIKDAEDLLAHFDALSKPPPDNAEVLKRAGLVMALTAWETYVEDRVREEVAKRLRVVSSSPIANFVNHRLEEELKRFHNPTADKTRRLFLDYLEIDVTTSWEWLQSDAPKAKKTLDDLISKRGDAVHRSKTKVSGGQPAPHLVKREDLEKSIRFFKNIVEATDRALIE